MSAFKNKTFLSEGSIILNNSNVYIFTVYFYTLSVLSLGIIANIISLGSGRLELRPVVTAKVTPCVSNEIHLLF